MVKITQLKGQEMTKDSKGVSRRDFIKAGSTAATLVVLAASGCSAPSTITVTKTVTPTPSPSTTASSKPSASTTTSPAPSTAMMTEVYTFFNQNEAATIKAIVAQLIPGDAQDPGALEAGAHIYIDHALNGTYASQQTTYRRGILAVNAYSRIKYNQNFTKLTAAQQIQVLTDMQTGTATGFVAPSATQFFTTLQQHCREGTFSDPVYGGNQNMVGWKMIGFPGAQVGYGDADMAVGADQAKKNIISMADMESLPMPQPQSGF